MNEPANFGNGGLDGDGFGFSCEASNINYPPYKVWFIFLVEDYRVLKFTANTFSTALFESSTIYQFINFFYVPRPEPQTTMDSWR